MTIEELQQKSNSIPEEGTINQARRLAIIILINMLMEEQE